MKRQKNKAIKRYIIISSCIVFLLAVATLLYYVYFFAPEARIKKYNTSIEQAMVTGGGNQMRDLLLDDLRHHRNDMYTKYAAYSFIRTYFNNGGDPYEVYEYVHAHSELAFLTEAETINATYFESMRNKKVPHSYSDPGMYIYLAYLEGLEKNGYGDVATLGSLAGQYAKSAYYKQMVMKEKKKGLLPTYPDYTEEQVKYDTAKALYFYSKVNDSVRTLSRVDISGEMNNVISYDMLDGLTQYAAGLRYLQAFGVAVPDAVDPVTVFGFVTSYSRKHIQTKFYSTVLLDAATFVLTSSDEGTLREKLSSFVFNKKLESPSGIFRRIFDSRYEVSLSKFADLNPYSKENILEFAKRDKDFKNWLILNGWTEKDFVVEIKK